MGNANDTKESKIFDTSTEQGLKAAEKYKARLENKYDKVTTTPVGLNRVKIEGSDSPDTKQSNGYEATCWNCQSTNVFHHSEVVGKGNAHYRCSDCGATGDLTDFMPSPSGEKPTPKPRKSISIDSTELHTWFERDRSHVELRSKLDDKSIAEWWDADVSEAIEDGFLNPRDYHQSAYEYAQSHGMLPDAPLHYIAMSGSHGCLPDHCEVYDTHKDAVQDLVELFGLGRTRKARLKRDSYLELKPNPIEINRNQDFGAEYCEIQECDCDNPAQHSDGGL